VPAGEKGTDSGALVKSGALVGRGGEITRGPKTRRPDLRDSPGARLLFPTKDGCKVGEESSGDDSRYYYFL
jgi:hypothetical protein